MNEINPYAKINFYTYLYSFSTKKSSENPNELT